MKRKANKSFIDVPFEKVSELFDDGDLLFFRATGAPIPQTARVRALSSGRIKITISGRGAKGEKVEASRTMRTA